MLSYLESLETVSRFFKRRLVRGRAHWRYGIARLPERAAGLFAGPRLLSL